MPVENPFSQEILNKIFKISPKHPDRIISRENSSLEFKESFGFQSLPKYFKTFAAFSNAKGGYIVFGVKDSPHILMGLSEKSLNNFQSIDPETITNSLNEHFAPEVHWEQHEYELGGKVYGLFYIHESSNKPILCKKNHQKDLKESDIYYRYRGRSQRIQYAELRKILEQNRTTEQRLWMRHLSHIAKIGVRDAAIFDLHTGSVSGTSGSFFIDESLLSQLSFIKEGEFTEVKGAPALKLIGNLEPFGGATSHIAPTKVIKTKGIQLPDIVLGFLKQEDIKTPADYIRQICFETTGFLPVYYYIQKSGLSIETALSLINNVNSRSQAKTKLAERITHKKRQNVTPPNSNTIAGCKKKEFIDDLKLNIVSENLTEEDTKYCLQAIRSLSKDEIISDSEYLRSLTKTWFNRLYKSAKQPLADNLRRAICWIDECLYMDDIPDA